MISMFCQTASDTDLPNGNLVLASTSNSLVNALNSSEEIMKRSVSNARKMFGAIISATALILSLWANPTLAEDPFRATNQRQIGENTEAAFKAFFEQGDYLAAERYLQQAESSEAQEPLAYAMKASLGYTLREDFSSLESYGRKTLEAAKQLTPTDPLRGNLYAAVGHFLQGAAVISREGTVKGMPQALSELRQVYQYMDKAEAVSPTDPEFNLLRGYMDLMLATSLPFADPNQAITRLEKFAGPKHLAYRGLALAYRNQKQYPQAIAAVDQAIQSANDNPELYYLKAQILASQGKRENNQSKLREAVENFDKAITKKTQLPASLVKQIERERRKTAERVVALQQ